MKRLILPLVFLIVACGQATPAPLPTPILPYQLPTVIVMTAAALASPEPTMTPTASPTFTPSPTTIPATFTATVTSTPRDYQQYTISYLRNRSYGGGEIESVEAQEENNKFTRYIIHYPSDGLTIYGFLYVPKGEGPFPVVIMIHGFVNSGAFNSLHFNSGLADALARAGFIVIHPILRGYFPSDSGDNMFRVGMTIDILNLMAIIKSTGGQPGVLEKAYPDHTGLMGQSMGGGIALRAMTVSPAVKAAVLYSSLSGDELKNARQMYKVTVEPQFQNELNTPPDLYLGISPMYYYGDITAPIQLYQGTLDETVPMSWSEETCDQIAAAGKNINCIYYEGEDHVFSDRVSQDFYGSMIDFYNTYLLP